MFFARIVDCLGWRRSGGRWCAEIPSVFGTPPPTTVAKQNILLLVSLCLMPCGLEISVSLVQIQVQWLAVCRVHDRVWWLSYGRRWWRRISYLRVTMAYSHGPSLRSEWVVVVAICSFRFLLPFTDRPSTLCGFNWPSLSLFLAHIYLSTCYFICATIEVDGHDNRVRTRQSAALKPRGEGTYPVVMVNRRRLLFTLTLHTHFFIRLSIGC